MCAASFLCLPVPGEGHCGIDRMYKHWRRILLEGRSRGTVLHRTPPCMVEFVVRSNARTLRPGSAVANAHVFAPSKESARTSTVSVSL